MNWTVMGVLIAANAPVYWLLWKVFFRDSNDFRECVRFWLTPDILSWIRGEWADDWWGELKLGFWIIGSAAAVLVEYEIIERLFLTP